MSFAARLHLPGQAKIPLSVEVDISQERLSLTAGDQDFGNWPLDSLEIHSDADGFHVMVDAEEMILKVNDEDAFAAAVGVKHRSSKSINGTAGAEGPLSKANLSQARYEELQSKTADVEEALLSDEVTPADAFAKWLRLLKEANRNHGQGSLTLHQFYEINTRLLDLIPEPPR